MDHEHPEVPRAGRIAHVQQRSKCSEATNCAQKRALELMHDHDSAWLLRDRGHQVIHATRLAGQLEHFREPAQTVLAGLKTRAERHLTRRPTVERQQRLHPLGENIVPIAAIPSQDDGAKPALYRPGIIVSDHCLFCFFAARLQLRWHGAGVQLPAGREVE